MTDTPVLEPTEVVMAGEEFMHEQAGWDTAGEYEDWLNRYYRRGTAWEYAFRNWQRANAAYHAALHAAEQVGVNLANIPKEVLEEIKADSNKDGHQKYEIRFNGTKYVWKRA